MKHTTSSTTTTTSPTSNEPWMVVSGSNWVQQQTPIVPSKEIKSPKTPTFDFINGAWSTTWTSPPVTQTKKPLPELNPVDIMIAKFPELSFTNSWEPPQINSSLNKKKPAPIQVPSVAPHEILTTTTTTSGLSSPTDEEKQNIEEELSKQSLYKTELCRSFVETGICRYGHKCQFAHGEQELRNILRHPKYKTENCKTFVATGTCPYGPRCRFIHPFVANNTPSNSGLAKSPNQKWSNNWNTSTTATSPTNKKIVANTTNDHDEASRLAFFKNMAS